MAGHIPRKLRDLFQPFKKQNRVPSIRGGEGGLCLEILPRVPCAVCRLLAVELLKVEAASSDSSCKPRRSCCAHAAIRHSAHCDIVIKAGVADPCPAVDLFLD